MSVILISKYFHPDTSIDAISSNQLIEKIAHSNKEIHIITTNNIYKEKKNHLKTQLHYNTPITVHRIKTLYSGQNKALQLIGFFVDGLRLVYKANKIPVTTVISLSNPPMIALVCSMLLRKKKWLYWTFDLYPDAFASANLISKDSFIFKMIDKLAYSFPPSYLISLGDKQCKHLQKKYKKNIPSIILPCGISHLKYESTPYWYNEKFSYIGYIGNIGKAHSKEFLIETIKNSYLLTNFKFIVSIYGEHKEEIEDFVKKTKSPNIVLVNSIERQHLSLIDIHVVSLLPEWTHISVPSKAVSAVCAGSTLCFFGSKDSDTWNMFSECSFHIDDLKSIPSVFSSISNGELLVKKRMAQSISNNLLKMEEIAFQQILEQTVS